MDIREREVLTGDRVVNGEPGKNQGLTRRRRTIAEKRRIVEETLEPGASVARVARAHEVNANQVFHWRRLYERGRLGPQKREATKLLPVRVTGPGVAVGPDPGGRRTTNPGRIELEWGKGCLRLEGNVDTAVLRVVLERLLA
jgi:transposase